MKPQSYTVTGTGNGAPIVINDNVTPISIGISVVVTGTVNYTVQHSYDSPASSIVTWFDDATLASETANGETTVDIPVSAVRLVVNSGSGTATITLVQAGI